jgi:hypothetical protein
VREGVILGINEGDLRQEARALAKEFAGAEQTEQAAASWRPYYRKMYLKAAAADHGMLRALPGQDKTSKC